jgi:hypothetical protein
MKYRIIFILLFIILPVAGVFSQTVVVKASLDTNKIIIGDQVLLKLKATYPAGTSLAWPILSDSLNENIEIIKKSAIDTLSKSAKEMTLGQSLTITSFDSGSFYIPQISFKYKKTGDTSYLEALTDSLQFNINTVAVDTTLAIKDIKGPLSVPLTFMEVLPYIIGIILIAAIVWLVIYYLRKRKRGESLIDFSKPKLPPHEIALSALSELRNKKLWQNNFVKLYYTELTEIIRTYMEGRFGVFAMEMTTDEIMDSLTSHNIQGGLKNKLRQTLVLADLVKFAKSNPLPNEHDQCLDIAFEFVNQTKSAEVPEVKNGQKLTEEKNIVNTSIGEETKHAD